MGSDSSRIGCRLTGSWGNPPYSNRTLGNGGAQLKNERVLGVGATLGACRGEKRLRMALRGPLGVLTTLIFRVYRTL